MRESSVRSDSSCHSARRDGSTSRSQREVTAAAIYASKFSVTATVSAQTISMAHENSDLTKTQKTEHLQETQKNQSALILINNDSSEQSEPKQNVKAAELKYGDVAGRIDFTLLLTGYAIFLTGTLIIPKVLLKERS